MNTSETYSIVVITRLLKRIYRHDKGMSSPSVYYYKAYEEELIPQEIVDLAREYYGKLWNYCGD